MDLAAKAPTEQMLLVGKGISHSRSPQLYAAAFELLGLDWRYGCRDCANSEAANRVFSREGFYACNVTMPYKALAFRRALQIDFSTGIAEGANLLLRTDQGLLAFNTDGQGFVDSLSYQGISLQGKRLVICGTGPTAHAVACAAVAAQANHVFLMSRDAQRAQLARDTFAEHLHRFAMADLPDGGAPQPEGELPCESSLPQEGCCSLEGALPLETRRDISSFEERISFCTYRKALEDIASADVVVNATPLGHRASDGPPFDCSMLSSSQIAYDLVYGKGETAFVRGARERHCRVFDGLGMLVGQAVLALELMGAHLSIMPAVPRNELFACLELAVGLQTK